MDSERTTKLPQLEQRLGDFSISVEKSLDRIADAFRRVFGGDGTDGITGDALGNFIGMMLNDMLQGATDYIQTELEALSYRLQQLAFTWQALQAAIAGDWAAALELLKQAATWGMLATDADLAGGAIQNAIDDAINNATGGGRRGGYADVPAIPEFAAPDVNVNVPMPKMAAPDVNVNVPMPKMAAPETPAINLPDIAAPDVDAMIAVPDWPMPETPAITMPDIAAPDVPVVTLPKMPATSVNVNVPMPKTPATSVNVNVPMPKTPAPVVNLPDIAAPDVDAMIAVPDWPMPETPAITLPDIAAPDVQMFVMPEAAQPEAIPVDWPMPSAREGASIVNHYDNSIHVTLPNGGMAPAEVRQAARLGVAEALRARGAQ